MKNIPQFLLLALLGSTPAFGQITLFSDSFDRTSNTDVNANSGASQSGTLSPLDWNSYTAEGGVNSVIDSNSLFIATDGTANSKSRIALDYDISDSSETIVSDGGFEISFTQTTGIGYAGSIHGSYSSNVYLSQASMTESTNGPNNAWQGLGVTIKGNGQVTIYSQSVTIGNGVASVWNVQGANDVRLVVNSEGFSTTAFNSVSIYINNTIVHSDIEFNWKTNDNVYLGVEAAASSASFDDITLQAIPETSTFGVLFGSVALAVCVTRRSRS